MTLVALYTALIAKLTQLRDSLILMGNGAELSQLQKMAVAIRDYEGGPGNANYKNNNPGNARYFEGGYLTKYEPVYRSPDGFAIFPSMAVGMLYLENLIKEKSTNHPSWTLLQFMENYAPTGDGNDPAAYANFIARRLSVDSSALVRNIIA